MNVSHSSIYSSFVLPLDFNFDLLPSAATVY
jgi:hypothetical protein